MGESAEPLVAIVVLAYNCTKKVVRCLTSLNKLSYSNYQVIVVDNKSADDVETKVTVEFPQAIFIQSGANLGYTGGNNLGITYALAQKAEYVLILNPDTVVLNPDFIGDVVAYCELHPQIGVAGPRVYLRASDNVQNTVLYAPGFWRNLWNWFAYRLAPAAFMKSQDSIVDAEVLNGVCVLLRGSCLRAVGLFDEAIFMYIEDADFDYRARSAGWKVQYLPIDSIVHEQQMNGYHMTSMVSFLLRRNSVYYLYKIGKRFEAWAYAAFSLAILYLRAYLSFNSEKTGEYTRFCRRLVAAYCQILFGQKLGRSFGPPYSEW
ncbi:MAG: glycosyltransferase family 2 protein [Acidobacteria bacterium]|nr:glycosyltransferase family 2 protein [Acidobacteriota bacterium]MBI3428055.1 glycosyltransferase family 2 protein [Acidobacteriota bacterium]